MSWRDRRAAVQLREEDLPAGVPKQNGVSFNVWYNKWSQGSGRQERYASPYRLDVDGDSGTTRGDESGTLRFCLYFARGMCSMGHRCQYLHHVPGEQDRVRYVTGGNQMLDCFGREKFGDYREDMSGVGSFRTVNKTLYVGGIAGALQGEDASPRKVESRLRFLFAQLGDLDRVRYVESKNCAFVRYKAQINAEFAKEAMANQPLTLAHTDTGILVKWAREDPDPEAQRRLERERWTESIDAMVHLLGANQDAAGAAATDLSIPNALRHAKKRRIMRTTTPALSRTNVISLYDSEPELC